MPLAENPARRWNRIAATRRILRERPDQVIILFSGVADEERPLEAVVLGDVGPLAAACAVVVHPVAHGRPEVDRHVGLHVRPVLDDATLPPRGRAAEQVDVVGTHPGIERHEVGALQHVDAVDLEDAGPGHGPVEGAQRRRRVPRVGEALRRQRDPARLGKGQRLRGVHRVNLCAATDRDAVGQSSCTSFSRTANMTASIRECSCSFSRMLRTWFLTVFSEMASC